MSRGLTDDFQPEEPEITNQGLLELIYALGAYLEQVDEKIDKILQALGLDEPKDEV